ncbi:MAG: sigma 54-interacting transcriptional regulator [Deltaproteobacteria bacterium]|nr:sigma 54-interacting transcriptional regulator [Deltaproteobacteria bacterium]
MILAENTAKLSVSLSNGMGVEIRLGLKEVRIGRGRDADLLLPDPSVSRLHARIFRVGEQYFLADTSRNGTFVGEKPVKQLLLEDNLSFRIGPYRIHFHRSGPTAASSSEPPTVPPGDSSEPAHRAPAKPRRTETSSDSFGIIGQSSNIKKLIYSIEKVAKSELPVLIEGETGSGKELVSRAIHDTSDRSEKPYVVVNCGAISPELIESELFGHEKGAFTGATAQRRGAFEIAHTGTIFLDEIGELPLSLQPKLLRALEQKEIKRVGGNETLLVDVRILAATNRNLREELTRKTFRDDLYFRIGAVSISVPPLRERRDDIAPLARHFLSDIALKLDRCDLEIAPAAEELLLAYAWPGNVRELRNAIQRAAVMGSGSTLLPEDFSFLIPQTPGSSAFEVPGDGAFSRWEQAEKNNILAELSRQKWNKTKTARELGIAKSTLFEKLKKYGIRAPGFDRG